MVQNQFGGLIDNNIKPETLSLFDVQDGKTVVCLFISSGQSYYAAKGFMPNEQFELTFGFLTPDGRYNMLTYFLADENGMSMKVVQYATL